jgi:hypothetical protein
MEYDGELLGDDGYPTSEFLDYVSEFKPSKDASIYYFLELLQDAWWMGKNGGVVIDLEEKEVTLHTFGWSGNEDIINAILNNPMLNNVYLKYYQWNVGGHYKFKINDKK